MNEDLRDCKICPRECHANRISGSLGYCATSAGIRIASIVAHHGEEPVISGKHGICNVFFTGCNLRCLFCQNHQISRGNHKSVTATAYISSVEEAVSLIEKYLAQGVQAVGFVSPSHVIPQVISIIQALHERGHRPVTVYNTNAYEKAETIRQLEGLIDVYLPDFKYITPELAGRYSGAPDYPEYAGKAIKEMYRQKGSYLFLNEEGLAERGLIIRHLVLPGHTDESKALLRYIAEEISVNVHISLMSQYYPAGSINGYKNLQRTLQSEEYYGLLDEMSSLGFRKGFIQEMNSQGHYRPDFSLAHPFGKE